MDNENKVAKGTIRVIVDVIILIIGIILIVLSKEAMPAITLVIGIVALGYGAIQLVVSIVKKLGAKAVLIPIICIAVGVVIVIFREFIANTALPFIVGAWITIMGIVSLVDALGSKATRSSWRVSMVIAIACIVLGIVLIVGVFSSTNFLAVILGICMVIYGIASLVNWILSRNTGGERNLN